MSTNFIFSASFLACLSMLLVIDMGAEPNGTLYLQKMPEVSQFE